MPNANYTDDDLRELGLLPDPAAGHLAARGAATPPAPNVSALVPELEAVNRRLAEQLATLGAALTRAWDTADRAASQADRARAALAWLRDMDTAGREVPTGEVHAAEVLLFTRARAVIDHVLDS